MKKRDYIIIGLLVISIGLNLYHYGYQYIYNRGFNAGANMVSNSVAQQFRNTGKVTMQYEGKQIILIPENALIEKAEKLIK